MKRIAFSLFSLSISAMAAASNQPKDIAPLLEPILKKSKLPAISAAVVKGEQIVALGAVGIRKVGDPIPVTKHDKFHIGSCTKMMTATLAAILIEEKLLSWDTTIGEVYGDRNKALHPEFRQVTLEQMLAHVGGMPAKPPKKLWLQAWEDQGKLSPVEQRHKFVSGLLEMKPAYRPGKKPVYSNLGYAVAGAMLETLAGKPWEELIQERLFDPLNMQSAGFRAPCSQTELDQPWGHKGKKPEEPHPDTGDNPDAIGPAGAVHTSMEDLAKFARFLLRKEPGTILKSAASFDKLNSTLPGSKVNGVGGCLVHNLDHFGGHCLQMTGSNTMWFTILWIFPAYDLSIVVSANSAPFSAFGTLDKVVAELLDDYRDDE